MGRRLLVTADDFGIGVPTSRGILDLAADGVVTSTVLLVNSPFAADSVRLWRQAGGRLELGWHPVLTLDKPVLPRERVPSLVERDGSFPPLGRFLRRLALGQIRRADVEAEFRAQLARFQALVGRPPANVNAHHHVHVFEPVGAALRAVLAEECPGVYVRRVFEPGRTLAAVPGGRVKRYLLSRCGRRAAQRQDAAGLPGNDALAGITDPAWVADPAFLERWLANTPGQAVELTCHPGHFDESLAGRDGPAERRVEEYRRLSDRSFLDAVAAAGFTLTTAAGPVAAPAMAA